MMPSAIRIFGYAIISAEGMIADANGRMPDALIIEADQSFFRASLARAQVVVHGRNSGEGGPDADRRHRIILTNTIAAFSCLSSTPRVLLWNPNGVSFAETVQHLPISEGIIAVIGGTKVFDLFLTIGYDAFYLSRATHAHLPEGRPVFSKVLEKSPQHILADHGLYLRRQRKLGDQLLLEEWMRELPQ
jgi:dihydrofolate reductase